MLSTNSRCAPLSRIRGGRPLRCEGDAFNLFEKSVVFCFFVNRALFFLFLPGVINGMIYVTVVTNDGPSSGLFFPDSYLRCLLGLFYFLRVCFLCA